MPFLRLMLVTCFFCFASPVLAAEPIRILAFGDSLTEGKGVRANAEFPAILLGEWQARGYKVQMLVSGENNNRSGNAVRRVDKVIAWKPDIVILQFGLYDLLHKVDTAQTYENLEIVVRKLQEAGIEVIVAGLKAPVKYGIVYRAKFNAIYDTLADQYGVILMPDLYKGVRDQPTYLTSGGILPNAKGHAVMAANLIPYVTQAIERLN